MALQGGHNVEVSIYAGSSAADPYSLGSLRATVSGVLIPTVHTGRHGSASWLKWTHLLLLPPNTDVRDAYNSQLDPARDNALGDTVILENSSTTDRTAFYVVFVEQVSRGTHGEHLRVYLDRFQPEAWPTDAL